MQLAGQVRRHDVVSRYGGEEFAMVLVETTEEQARVVAERCRALLESAALVRNQTAVRVTASVGIAALPREGVESVERLIDLADEALYHAKSEGRNRVAIAA
jgi:diguanylate cyclase (GGDEF)-like protein